MRSYTSFIQQAETFLVNFPKSPVHLCNLIPTMETGVASVTGQMLSPTLAATGICLGAVAAGAAGAVISYTHRRQTDRQTDAATETESVRA